MKKVRVAVIGSGRWGTNILKTLQGLTDCEVAYTATHNWKPLVTTPDIDAVIIATPSTTHASIALPFIKRGLAVYIEKPMTANLKEAKQLVDAAQKSGARLFVGHIHLYNPAYKTLKKEIKTLGKIRYMVGEGTNNGPYRDDVSALWDWAPHDLSVMTDLAGMPTSVQAWSLSTLRPKTKLADVAQIKLTFKNGVTGFIFNTWLFPEKRKRLTIVGVRGSAVFDDTAKDNKVALYKNMGPKVSGQKVIKQDPQTSHLAYAKTSPLEVELAAFVDMVRVGKKVPTDAVEGLAIVRILDAAEKSISAGGRSKNIS